MVLMIMCQMHQKMLKQIYIQCIRTLCVLRIVESSLNSLTKPRIRRWETAYLEFKCERPLCFCAQICVSENNLSHKKADATPLGTYFQIHANIHCIFFIEIWIGQENWRIFSAAHWATQSFEFRNRTNDDAWDVKHNDIRLSSENTSDRLSSPEWIEFADFSVGHYLFTNISVCLCQLWSLVSIFLRISKLREIFLAI